MGAGYIVQGRGRGPEGGACRAGGGAEGAHAHRFGELSPSPGTGQRQDHGRPGAGSAEAAPLSPAETSGPAMGDRERNKKRLLELLQAAGTGNTHCADCGAEGKGTACGAGAARHGPSPWLVGPFSKSPSKRDPDSSLAWDLNPSRWSVSGGPDGSPSPCFRSPGPQSSLRTRCGPCPGSLSLSHRASYHPGHHLRPWALPALSDPEVLTSDASWAPATLHCGALSLRMLMRLPALSLRAGPSLAPSRFLLPRSPRCRCAKGWAKHGL